MDDKERLNAVQGSNEGHSRLEKLKRYWKNTTNALIIALALTTGGGLASSCSKEDNPISATEYIEEKTPTIEIKHPNTAVPSNGIEITTKKEGSTFSVFVADTCIVTAKNTESVEIHDANGNEVTQVKPGTYTLHAINGKKTTNKEINFYEECNILASETKINTFGGSTLTIKEDGIYLDNTKIFYAKDGYNIDRNEISIFFSGETSSRSNNEEQNQTQLYNNDKIEKGGIITLIDRDGKQLSMINVAYEAPAEWQLPSNAELGESYNLNNFIKLDNGRKISSIEINGTNIPNDNRGNYQFNGDGHYEFAFYLTNLEWDKEGSIKNNLDVKAKEYIPWELDKINYGSLLPDNLGTKYTDLQKERSRPFRASSLLAAGIKSKISKDQIIIVGNETPSDTRFTSIGEPMEPTEHATSCATQITAPHDIADISCQYLSGGDIQNRIDVVKANPDKQVIISVSSEILVQKSIERFRGSPTYGKIQELLSYDNVTFIHAAIDTKSETFYTIADGTGDREKGRYNAGSVNSKNSMLVMGMNDNVEITEDGVVIFHRRSTSIPTGFTGSNTCVVLAPGGLALKNAQGVLQPSTTSTSSYATPAVAQYIANIKELTGLKTNKELIDAGILIPHSFKYQTRNSDDRRSYTGEYLDGDCLIYTVADIDAIAKYIVNKKTEGFDFSTGGTMYKLPCTISLEGPGYYCEIDGKPYFTVKEFTDTYKSAITRGGDFTRGYDPEEAKKYGKSGTSGTSNLPTIHILTTDGNILEL